MYITGIEALGLIWAKLVSDASSKVHTYIYALCLPQSPMKTTKCVKLIQKSRMAEEIKATQLWNWNTNG
jgi:hypothetical protein